MQAGGTVVVLMGLSRVRVIAETLMARNCPAATPVAVISRGTYLNQDCRVGTLKDIGTRIEGVQSPAVIVLGEVVGLRNGGEISAEQLTVTIGNPVL